MSSDGQLYKYLKKNKRLKEPQAAYIVKQVCEGIQYLHSKHVLHRDLKPENIILENVNFNLFRVLSNYVILDGQFIIIQVRERLYVVLHYIYHRKL